MLRTYDEWKALGYQVKKGQRAIDRSIKGRAVFSLEQVKPRCPHGYGGDEDREEGHDMMEIYFHDKDWF